LIKPTSGKASVVGFDVVKQAKHVRRHIGLTGQNAAVDELLTGRENLVLFGRMRGMNRKRARNRADELLTRFSLTDAGDQRVSTYSGGMRRRVDIACGLVVHRGCFSSTSRPPGWTRAAAARSGTWSAR
jgi:ABC-2 type transport system ATP-binding protein